MKILLLKDVAGVGQNGTVKNVADGYAMNYLIPKRLAEAALPEKVAQLEKEQRDAEATRARERVEAEDVAKHLEGAFVTLRVTANEEGHLYSNVSARAVVSRLKAERGVDVPESAIVIPEPIKSLGRAVVSVRLLERRIPVTLSVEREN